MTDVKDNSLDEMLADFELVSMKSHSEGETATAEREQLKQAILEEMDRVIADLIGEDEKPVHKDIEQNSRLMMGSSINEPIRVQNALKRQLRHRWREVRERL